ncbi:MAG: hypothetical protein H0U95_06925 [Bacteroidetes bacterium]|nr:hypothetical protein [Bacteroidota bacterium]
MRTIKYLIIIISLFVSTNFFAQKGRGHGHGGHRGRHGKVVVVKRSSYRPAKIVVYHPYWRPKYAYNRRWVYFPRYNFYWDNWRNHYVYYNNNVWVSQPTAPPVIVNVNLENEKSVELNETDDDVDDVYQNNSKHKEEIKPD